MRSVAITRSVQGVGGTAQFTGTTLPPLALMLRMRSLSSSFSEHSICVIEECADRSVMGKDGLLSRALLGLAVDADTYTCIVRVVTMYVNTYMHFTYTCAGGCFPVPMSRSGDLRLRFA